MSEIYFIDREAEGNEDGSRQNISEDITSNTTSVWTKIIEQYNKEREGLEEYLLRKRGGAEEQTALEQHPIVMFLNENIFPILIQGLILLLEKVRDETSCHRQKSSFNGIDFLSEYLYNTNHRYPERIKNWTYIFDMGWVQDHLEASPRPYYPFSLIWSRDYAALKIQSYMRGYWVRRRDDVQEVRNFWKDYKLSRKLEAT